MSLEDIIKKTKGGDKKIVAVTLQVSIVFSLLTIFASYSLFAAAQDSNKTYHSDATGATITFHGKSITSKTSNVTHTNTTGITGYSPGNSMRNMTNPMFLMKKNPLSNLSNPLANMKNPLANK
ncbi:MAG TPA: hypothetical protein VFJ51_10370 [Nitrososphaeraceae archaeon]|nr:hypothetical protein [Nitrososphaeraceae archaeon]